MQERAIAQYASDPERLLWPPGEFSTVQMGCIWAIMEEGEVEEVALASVVSVSISERPVWVNLQKAWRGKFVWNQRRVNKPREGFV